VIAYLLSPHMAKDAPRARVSDFLPDRAHALAEYLREKRENGEEG
jgi:hypothetical protein